MYRRTVTVALSFLFASIEVFGEHLPYTADPDRFDKALARVELTNLKLVRDVEERHRKDQPLFVVVPGVLGSKLLDEEGMFWGEKGLGDAKFHHRLLFEGVPAHAEFLDDFSFIRWRINFYGSLRQHLRFSNATDIPHLREFAYDWRQDIRNVAQQLDDFMTSEENNLPDRHVVFLAHSMGGLVVTWWYHEHYLKRKETGVYRFAKDPRVLFLGTPHYGSTTAFLLLTEGYGATAARLERALVNHFLDDLNDVGYSFYSVYQLLPMQTRSIQFEGSVGPFEVLDQRPWQLCGWGSQLQPFLDRRAQRRGTPKLNFYEDVLKPRLTAAREFRHKILSFDEIPGSVYFYSDHFETPATLKVSLRGGKCHVDPETNLPGDARVVAEIARRSHSADERKVVYRLGREHGQLQTDDAFMAYIDDMRRGARQELANLFVYGDGPKTDVLQAFRQAGALLPIPIDYKAAADLPTQAVLQFNRQVLQPRPDARIADYLYRIGTKSKRDGQSMRLYALVVAFGPDTEAAVYAANRIGKWLLDRRVYLDAAAYLEFATSRLPKFRKLDQEFVRDKIYLNLGVAYEALQRYEEAAAQYERSRDKKARAHLKRLEKDRLIERREQPAA